MKKLTLSTSLLLFGIASQGICADVLPVGALPTTDFKSNKDNTHHKQLCTLLKKVNAGISDATPTAGGYLPLPEGEFFIQNEILDVDVTHVFFGKVVKDKKHKATETGTLTYYDDDDRLRLAEWEVDHWTVKISPLTKEGRTELLTRIAGNQFSSWEGALNSLKSIKNPTYSISFRIDNHDLEDWNEGWESIPYVDGTNNLKPFSQNYPRGQTHAGPGLSHHSDYVILFALKR